ncbi:MAG: penicillin-binding transpeptidase domain-containing protein [Polyangiaceae bacterium]
MRRVSGVIAFLGALALAAPVALAKKDNSAKGDDVKLTHVKTAQGEVKAERADASGEVQLTLDPELQKAATKLLAATKAPSGAIVVSDVKTGRILAWASRGSEGDMVRKAKYPGASLFKVVTAATLLDKDKLHLGDTVCYQGGESRLVEDDIKPGCRSGDAKVKFEVALGRSLNVVFARAAMKHLKPSVLAGMAEDFGIGAPPPLDLPADATSIKIPDDDLGFARAASGFGVAKMSPLAALDIMTTIANGGERLRLTVSGAPDDVKRQSLGRVIKRDTARDLVRMLEVTTRSGTSAKAFAPQEGKPTLSVAGKTGTLLYKKPKRLVSWFAGFAPSREPEIAVAVMLANDEKWWRKGNEVARDVFDAYFELKKKRK